MVALHDTNSSTGEELASHIKALELVLLLAFVAACIGLGIGAISSSLGLIFGATFTGAWNQYGFIVGIVVAVLTFLVMLLVTLAVDALMSTTDSRQKARFRA